MRIANSINTFNDAKAKRSRRFLPRKAIAYKLEIDRLVRSYQTEIIETAFTLQFKVPERKKQANKE
jgi:hypothetical protein